jgi:hypothetical protein
MRSRGRARGAFVAAFLVGGFAADARAQQCVVGCDGEGGYYAPHEDREKLARLTDPILRELRTCLDNAGARAVSPAVVMRFDAEGNVASGRVEASGYESLPCVGQATAKLQRLQLTHETSVRCACGLKPAAPPSSAPPPPIAPVAPPPPQITVVPQQQQPPPYYVPQQQPPPP